MKLRLFLYLYLRGLRGSARAITAMLAVLGFTTFRTLHDGPVWIEWVAALMVFYGFFRLLFGR